MPNLRDFVNNNKKSVHICSAVSLRTNNGHPSGSGDLLVPWADLEKNLGGASQA